MLPFALSVGNSSAKKGSACAQLMREAAGGARRVCGASSVKKNHDTLVVCRMQKCACAVQCVVRVSCGEQFTQHMCGVDAALWGRIRMWRSECAGRGGVHCRGAGSDGAHAALSGERVFYSFSQYDARWCAGRVGRPRVAARTHTGQQEHGTALFTAVESPASHPSCSGWVPD